jgi:hypothetical protein
VDREVRPQALRLAVWQPRRSFTVPPEEDPPPAAVGRKERANRELDVTNHDPRLAAEFAATLMGGRVADGPPPPDSMLAWLMANSPVTPEEIAAEWGRRGIQIDPADGWAWDNPRFRSSGEEKGADPPI